MIQRELVNPLLVYDGDCSFCRLWIARWQSYTGDRVEYAPFQEVAARFPQIPREDFARSLQLVMPGGAIYSAAHAVFRTLAYAPGQSGMLWAYRHLPGVASLSEWAYRVVAHHRDFFYKVTRLLWEKHLERPSFFISNWLFLRFLGVIYLIAFLSLSSQITGLIGRQGILPVGQYLEFVRSQIGIERYFYFPSLVWLNASDGFLRFLTLGGAGFSLLVILDIATLPVLIILFLFYLSLVTAGQSFMAFQWDALLLETGFLAILLAPSRLFPRFAKAAEPSKSVLWLFRLLLFRLMFSSGAAKLLSGDPAWRHLTALQFHYEAQPLPTPIAWYMNLLPAWFQTTSAGVMFFVELFVPFLIFAPRRPRHIAAGSLVFFQVLIGLTGNYTFFNLLTIALCLLLFDDAALRTLISIRQPNLARGAGDTTGRPRVKRWLITPLAALLAVAGLLEIAELFLRNQLPRLALALLAVLQPMRIINSYGLFAVMTTSRPEIIVEGSNDGETWTPYEFKYKPGDLRRAPPWIEPFQPRLDWQMWFAALGSYENQPWFVNLMLRLLQGAPEVLNLLGGNPFPHAPPHYVRALLDDYRFTDWVTKGEDGAWWRRKLRGVYFPVARLEEESR
jgi:predicted DCC family thiol-disulfide oxidoreductase YuxK